MDITDKGAIEKGSADLGRVDHMLVSVGLMLNGMIANNGGSCPWALRIVSSPFKVYIACQPRLFWTGKQWPGAWSSSGRTLQLPDGGSDDGLDH
jgi:hypothetical protein